MEKLGPFQPMWQAWDEANEEILRKPLSHFRRAVEIQYDELDEHLAAGDRAAAAREAADVISIALNTLRWLGYQAEDVAAIAQARAANRLQGKTIAILDKYEREYDI